MELVEIGVWILELMMSIMSVMIFLNFLLLSFGLALSVFSLIFFFRLFFVSWLESSSVTSYHEVGGCFGGFCCVAIPPLSFPLVM
jgi:hypothetical protein